MEQQLFDWILSIPKILTQFSTWLFTPLEYINMSPITIFTFAGISAILIFHLVKLVNPIA